MSLDPGDVLIQPCYIQYVLVLNITGMKVNAKMARNQWAVHMLVVTTANQCCDSGYHDLTMALKGEFTQK